MDSIIGINSNEEKEIIFDNLLKMLYNRNKIKQPDIEKYKKMLKSNITEYNINDFRVFFINYRISSKNKIDNINKIINNGKNNIFITRYIPDRIWLQLIEANIEVFKYEELMINVIDHDFVPKHEKLTDDEKKDFYKDFLCTPKQLPRILLYDPISRYYKYEINDIIRITRPSIMCGNSITYRKVVNSDLINI
mgnify:CR=1 FL=1